MEIKVGNIYLGLMNYNSKKITWRPCRVTEITETHYVVAFLEGGGRKFEKMTGRLRKVNGQYKIVSEPTLREVTDTWVQNEFYKIDGQRNALNAAEEVIKQCYFRNR